MTGRLRIGVAAAVALLLTASGMLRLLASGGWVWAVVGAVAMATLSGEVARRLVRPRALVVLVQVLAVFWYSTVVLAHEVAYAGVVPTLSVIRKFGDLYSAGAEDIQHTAPGGPATAGITAIIVMSLGALAILVDALAATYGAAPVAGLPLLALYLVPATRTGGGYDWLAFVLAALGFTALLSAEGRDRLGRWGRPLVHAGARRDDSEARRTARVDTGPIAATGHQITMIALVAAILAPVFLPTISSGLFGLGPSGGAGSGGGTGGFSQVVNLKANLNSKVDNVVLTYKPADTKPLYLRLNTLDVFDGLSKTPFTPFDNAPTQPLPPGGQVTDHIPGYTGEATPPVNQTDVDYVSGYPTEVQQDEKGPSTIPEPYPLSTLTRLGDRPWFYRPDNLAVVSNANMPKGYKYTLTSFDLVKVLTPENYAAVPPVTDEDKADYQLDPDLLTASMPAGLKGTAEKIVQDAHAKNPIEEANALQSFFQNPNRFTYTTAIPDQQTGDEAIDYLLAERQGYCQTFAMTMAAMARELGIPARVAVGFTPGKADAATGTYTVRMHDYHAWPELWFHGLGWLRFEPTVGIGASSGGGHGLVPSYPTTSATQNPSSSASSSASDGAAGPSAHPTSGCPIQQQRAGLCGPEDNGTAFSSSKAFGTLGWFGAVLRFFDYWLFGGSTTAIVVRFVLLAALLVACVPMVLRLIRRRRRGRIASGRSTGRTPDADELALDWENADSGVPNPSEEPERARVMAAWAEVRDSATDLGYPWPSSETPRQSAERIIKQAHLSRSAQDAMNRVTRLTERAHYAPTLRKGSSGVSEVPAKLFDDVRTIRSGLAEPVNRRTRVRAAVLPASTLAALRERREDLTGRTYERVQRVGGRLRLSGSRGGRDTRGTRGGGRPGAAKE